MGTLRVCGTTFRSNKALKLIFQRWVVIKSKIVFKNSLLITCTLNKSA